MILLKVTCCLLLGRLEEDPAEEGEAAIPRRENTIVMKADGTTRPEEFPPFNTPPPPPPIAFECWSRM